MQANNMLVIRLMAKLESVLLDTDSVQSGLEGWCRSETIGSIGVP